MDWAKVAIIDAMAGVSPQRAAARYLTPIANLPLICHVFDEVAATGISRARVIADADVRPELESVLTGGHPWGVEVSYANAQDGDGHRALLTELNGALDEGAVLVCPGDCLFPNQLGGMRDRFSAGDGEVVPLSCAVTRPERNLADSDQPPGPVCDTVMVLAPSAQRVVQKLLSSSENGPDLIKSMLASGCPSVVCEPAGWCYSDSTEALLTANRMMLDLLPVPAVEGSFGDRNRVYGRVTISPEAQVSNCTLHGPTTIDDGALVEDSFLGPFTSIGPGAVISGAEIDNTVVLARAEIRHPGSRIEASIIGERASVVRSFEMPKGLHLRLGPDSQVTLS